MSETNCPNSLLGGSKVHPLPAQIPAPPPPASPSDTLSQLTPASGVTKITNESQLRANDIGLPPTPEKRCLLDVDEELCSRGYDSDSQPSSWEGSGEINREETEVEEASLGAGNGGDLPVMAMAPPRTSVLLPIEDVGKLKNTELREELRKRNLSVRGKKAV